MKTDDGITSFSVKPVRMVLFIGLVFSVAAPHNKIKKMPTNID